MVIVSLYFMVPESSGCQPIHYEDPPGYSLDKPQTFVLNESLHEISGICFVGKRTDTIYAIEDENGKLFYWHLGDRDYQHLKFDKKGDYEDVTVLKEKEFIVLRSDGSLYKFPITQVHDKKEDGVQIFEHILPEGEYEGLFADEDGKMYAMCKNCPIDKHKAVTIYILQEDQSGKLSITSNFKVKVSGEEVTSINAKVKYHPSALARHPLTKDWYILSSVNKSLLILDSQWKIKGYYQIRPSNFRQPEGICFDPKGNMYISNEGAEGLANVLVFAYHPK
jgi:uncharacterized protein YjiK